MMIDESRRSIEVLAEGQGKVIMLKNKYRFRMVESNDNEGDQGDLNYYSQQSAAKQRCKSAVKLRQSSSKSNLPGVYRSQNSIMNKDNTNNQVDKMAQNEM